MPDLGIVGVLLIGSYARGEQCPHSDFDLIVLVNRRTHNAQARFIRAIAEQGITLALDVGIVEHAELARNSPSITLPRRMRFLDVANGSRRLYGIEFRDLLQPPPPPEVLRYLLGGLAGGPELDEQDVLLAALAEHYARTREWTTKARLGATSDQPIVRLAWAIRCSSADAGDRLSQTDAVRFIDRARAAVAAALADGD